MLKQLQHHGVNVLFNVIMGVVTAIGMIIYYVQSTHADGPRSLMSREEEAEMMQ